MASFRESSRQIRIQLVAEWLLVGLLAARFLQWLSQPGRRAQVDFTEFFYIAGWRIARGQNPYDFVTQWGDAFNSPPWFALMVAPLSSLSPQSAAHLWIVINLGMLAAVLWLSLSLAGISLGFRRGMLVLLALLAWRPVAWHLELGQNALLVVAAGVGAAFAVERGWHRAAGLFLVVATIKPQLIFLLGPGLTVWCWRSRRSIALPVSFLSGLSALALVCWVIVPTWVADLASRPAPVGFHVNTRALLMTAFGDGVATGLMYLSIALIGSLLILGFWARSNWSLVQLTALTLAATLIVTPYAHLHDYVLLVLPLILAVQAVSRWSAPWTRVLSILCLAWAAVRLDVWLNRWLETDRGWAMLLRWMGEEGAIQFREQSLWNLRFVAMLVPLLLTALLIRAWYRTPHEGMGWKPPAPGYRPFPNGRDPSR